MESSADRGRQTGFVDASPAGDGNVNIGGTEFSAEADVAVIGGQIAVSMGIIKRHRAAHRHVRTRRGVQQGIQVDHLVDLLLKVLQIAAGLE